MYFLFIQYIFYFIHVRNIDKYLYQNESSPRNHDKFELSQRESFLVLTKKKLHFCWWFWSRKSSQVEHLAYQKNLCLTTHLNDQRYTCLTWYQRERKRNNRLKSSSPPSVQFSLSLSLFFGGDKDLVELHERKHQENFLWQSFNETYVNCLIQLNSVSCNDQLSNWKLKCRYFKLTADLWI